MGQGGTGRPGKLVSSLIWHMEEIGQDGQDSGIHTYFHILLINRTGVDGIPTFTYSFSRVVTD